ncbi:acyl-ACP desaturase [Mycobacteroides abscessus]|uniref:acyl-ACP desaturase n=1 Tax=Mycobacteroides abscessus TaxID=36809 RepID=UPI00031DEFC8|nr:acyl-ACP desaturase [Mycobacteroides abscessus]AMU77303.1 acyl-ACP desaturase [Mycobacteroides abscessus]ANO26248.1 acyl-ACP desaturase [Mycobacteroides abscessus]MBN7316782.1 acyl-ACP desaturase [Mycobacteroides abscessus subsp. massiliense]MBN7320198.1 acyl-ACP desaturase [Mycobacteroides abscessus subsp. massiliense]RIU33764.1 acyl-ACP desaturase [Mycobacteroides abscessus]
MRNDFTDLELLYELEPVVEENVHRHLGVTKDWSPHDYVPWAEGRNFRALGGQDWDPEQSKLSEVAKAAMITGLLTEDNLPSYHREIAMNFTMDGPWGTWVNRWTAEENRHGIAIRDYLVVTRSVDPIELEKLRVEQMTRGFSPGQNGQNLPFAESLFDSVVYVTFQELATRLSWRNTGKACAEPIADELLKRISTDENLHMIFYRNLVEAGLALAPNQVLRSIHRRIATFTMPSYTIPDIRRRALAIATAGIYDPQLHLDHVLMPVLRKWRIFERDDIPREAERYREDLDRYIGDLKKTAADFDEVKAKYLERQTKRAERLAAKAEMIGA